MALSSGRLRHRVKIQRQQEVRDPETGEVRVLWKDVASVWAAIEPLSVREFMSAQSIQSQITARITVRYRSDLTAKMRITYKNRVYNPQGWLPDPDSGLEYLTAPVSEGVNDGR